MSKLFSLDDRLAACASFVRQDSRIADIGTDHAYLPVWLAKQGIIKSAVAADIRPMPLERGVENIKKYDCEDKVSTRLSDGLKEISPDEVDDIVIAGMGGELIVDIISNAEWLKDGDRRLILQPMTKAHVLRKYLLENGFEILAEKACKHGGKNYTVIFVAYSGKTSECSPTFHYIGMLDPNDALAREYVGQVLKKLNYKSTGKKHSGDDSTEIDNIINEIKSVFAEGFNMVTVRDIYNYIDTFAPFDTAEAFDNVGILVGDPNKEVSKAIVTLDITKSVVEEAEKLGAELIISHHPVIFNPLKRLSFDSVPAMLAAKGISAISAHTNLDKSEIFGVNTELAKAMELVDCKLSQKADILFVANTQKTLTSHEFAEVVKNRLNSESLTYTEMCNTINKVGVSSGAGGSEIFGAIAEDCDAFVTGEIKHHELLAANESGISVFCVGHYKSEDIVIAPLAEKLGKRFETVQFVKSKKFSDGVKFF